MAIRKYLPVVLSLFVLACTQLSCIKVPLSPARKLEGTWKTPMAVTFYYSTDYCGGYPRVAKFTMSMTWTIKEKSENEVSIEWSADTRTSDQSIYNPPCNYYTPMVTPKSLTGKISSSQMDLYEDGMQVGTMSFTSDNLTGKYLYEECLLYCYGYGTDDKALILQKK